MSDKKIPTLLGIFILIIGVGAGVFLVQSRQILRIGASQEYAPQDVRVTNVTDNSFSVSFITDQPVVSYVNWGENSSGGKTTPAAIKATTTHMHTIRGLSPNRDYFFYIYTDETRHDNNGIPWKVTTGADLGTPLEPKIIAGTVIKPDNTPAAGVLVHISSGQMARLTTQTSNNGSWVIPISTARTPDLNSYANLNPETQLEILVQGGEDGVATAQTKLSLASPTHPITLGQVLDFTDREPYQPDDLPISSIEIPENNNESVGFSVEEITVDPDSNVTLDSHEDGEVVNTVDPEFFGQGPAGAELQITVESDPVHEGSVKIGSSGSWSWSPPDNLEPGTHTVTIRWTDTNGFLRTIKRSFIVQAADGPSFESTPSGTESPSPTATSTPLPTSTPTTTATPIATVSATPSPTARVTVPSTDSGIPEPGTITPTLSLAVIATGFIAGGIAIGKKVI